MRFESKFILKNWGEVKSLISLCDFLLERDPHCLKGSYPVHSLYFDGPHEEFYRQKLEGEFVHEKIRLRCYHPEDTSKAHLERKAKRGRVQKKWRAPFHPQRLERWGHLLGVPQLLPRMSVYYDRLAWGDEQLRVTLDFHIGPQAGDHKGVYCLEIKSNTLSLPPTAQLLLKRHQLSPRSFSKYAYCVEQFNYSNNKVWENLLR